MNGHGPYADQEPPGEAGGPDFRPPTVFLSYAHDDENHAAAVHELASLLEKQGIAVVLDVWHNERRRDWYAWILRELPAADFVLMVASPKYRVVGDGSPPRNVHRGVRAEARLLRELLYRDHDHWLERVLPVILPGRSLDELPTFMQPYSTSHFIIDAVTEEGVEELLRVLAGRPQRVRPPRGRFPVLPPDPPDQRRGRRGPIAWVRKKWSIVALAAIPLIALVVVPSSEAPDGPSEPEKGASARNGAIEVLAVGHSLGPDTDRITATVRNTHPERVLITQINVYLDYQPPGSGHEWCDGGCSWDYSVSEDMSAGPPAKDGTRRTHGFIHMNGSTFQEPVVGRGYLTESGAWRRLLTFSPQKFLEGTGTVSIVIDVPTKHLLQKTSAAQPAGPMAAINADFNVGSLLTHVELHTPDDRSFACDYLRRRKNDPPCGSIDPAAEVRLPR